MRAGESCKGAAGTLGAGEGVPGTAPRTFFLLVTLPFPLVLALELLLDPLTVRRVCSASSAELTDDFARLCHRLRRDEDDEPAGKVWLCGGEGVGSAGKSSAVGTGIPIFMAMLIPMLIPMLVPIPIPIPIPC
jgi:hypothetical protein